MVALHLTERNSSDTAAEPDIPGLLNLFERGEIDSARAAARASEGFVPATEAQWQQFHNLLEKLNLRAQDEIMTLAFLDRMPDAPRPRLNYALILLERRGRQRLPLAQAQIDLLLPHMDPSPDFLNRLAGCLSRLQNWQKLMELAETGLRLHPSSYRLQFYLAVALFQMGRLGAASAAFETALRYANKNIVLYLEILGFADRNAATGIGNMALDQALQLAMSRNSEPDWPKLLFYLQEKFDQPRIDRLCGIAASELTDTGTLALLFDFAVTQATPAVAATIGRRLHAIMPDRHDIIEKVAALERRGNSRYPSETWWQIVKS